MSADCGPLSVGNGNKPFLTHVCISGVDRAFHAVKTVRLNSALQNDESLLGPSWVLLSAVTQKGSNMRWENPPPFKAPRLCQLTAYLHAAQTTECNMAGRSEGGIPRHYGSS